MRVIQNKTPLL